MISSALACALLLSSGIGDSLPGLVIDVVNKSIPGTIIARKTRYEAPATVILEDTELLDPQNKRVAMIGSVKATVSISDILSGNLVITELTILRPKLSLAMQDGHLNLERAFVVPGGAKSTEEKSNTEIRIERVRVDEASLTYADPGKADITANHINGSGRVEVFVKTGTVFVTAGNSTVGSGSVALPDLTIPFSNVRVEGFRLRGTRLAVDGLRMTAAGAKVKGKTRIRLDQGGDLDVNVTVDAPVGAWPQGLEKPPFALPAVDSTLKVTGAFDDPRVVATGSFRPFAAYKLPFGAGTFDVVVSPEKVTLRSVGAAMGTKGKLSATGTYGIRSKRLSLESTLASVPLGLLAAPAELSPAPRGVASGTVDVSGIVDGKAPLDVVADVRLYALRAYDLTPPSPTRARASLVVLPDRLKITSGRLTGEGLSATANGTIFLEEERLVLDLSAEVADPAALVPQIPEEIVVGASRFDGRAVGPYERTRVEGTLAVVRVDAYGVPAVDARALLAADARVVAVDNIRANVAGGTTTGWVRLGLGERGALSGEVAVNKVSLDLLKPEGQEDLQLAGLGDVQATLSGLVKAPLVHARAALHRVVVNQEQVGEVRADAWISTDDVRVATLTVVGPLLEAANEGEIALHLKDERIAGRLKVARVSLEKIAATAEQKLVGSASGRVFLSGAFTSPTVRAPLQVEGLGVQDIALGDGPVLVRFVPDAASPADKPEQLLLASAQLVGPRGDLSAQVGFAVQREVINAAVELSGTDLEPWARLAGADEQGRPLLPWEGTGQVTATVVGPVNNPEVKAQLHVPQLAIYAPAQGARLEGAVHQLSNGVREWDVRGPLRVDATFVSGSLEAVVCAFPDRSAPSDDMALCGGGEQLWADISGPLNIDTGGFDLTAVFGVAEERVQNFVRALADANIKAAGHVNGTLHLRRNSEEDEPQVSGSLLVHRLTLDSPDAEPILLVEAREIEIDRTGAIHFNLPPTPGGGGRQRAPVLFKTGESTLQISGTDTGALNLKTKSLGLRVDGQVALALVKPFTQEVQAAGGEIEAKINIGGNFDRPQIVGSLAPMEGAFITPRAIGRRLELVAGRITTEILNTGDGLLLLKIDKAEGDTLELALDDGTAALEGDILIDLDAQVVKRWNLHAFGSGLFFRIARGYVETAFDLEMVMVDSMSEGAGGTNPMLRGRVEVNDGQIKETFELRNFVVTKAGSDRRSKPLREVLEEINLANLLLDVDVVVHNFDARANLATFRADGALRGLINVQNYLVAPAVSGAIEVVDGIVQFPYARFEVMQTQVEFPPAKDGRINPHIFLSARGELEPPRNGLDSEVPCVLTLDGDLDRLALKLSAEATEYNFTEGALLRFVLLGTPLSANAVVTDADAALRAVSSELTAAFSRDLEEAIADQLGAQLSFNVFYEDGQLKGGVRYQLGERLEFDGEAAFANVGGTTGNNGGSVTEARIRLLLLDHLPYALGRELAFEGHVTTGDGINTQASTNLRFSYRFFEY